MDHKLLQLHFSQLHSLWSKSKYNTYSDSRVKAYHYSLQEVVSSLEKEDFTTLSGTDIIQRFYIIFFVFKSLEFLNSSTTSIIPFEIVAVLEEALNEWVDSGDYLIVTSLVNGSNNYSFDPTLILNEFIYQDIELMYKVKFEKRLIQINLPSSTSRDYLANVVLYHELAHFIDRKFEITRVIYIELLNDLSVVGSDEKKEIFSFFPYLDSLDNVAYFTANYHPSNVLASHIAEYFCDLFASQYILNCSNNYLSYITLNNSTYSNSHPATTNRVLFVDNYLNSEKSYLIEKYKKTIESIFAGKTFERKSQEILSNDFELLLPIDIFNSKQLHSLFVKGWSLWLDDWVKIEKASHLEFSLTREKVYEIINNLIEKSIGNYIVTTEWAKSKKS